LKSRDLGSRLYCSRKEKRSSPFEKKKDSIEEKVIILGGKDRHGRKTGHDFCARARKKRSASHTGGTGKKKGPGRKKKIRPKSVENCCPLNKVFGPLGRRACGGKGVDKRPRPRGKEEVEKRTGARDEGGHCLGGEKNL